MKIPTFERQVDIQGAGLPQGSVAGAGAEGEAMARFGEAGTSFAATGIRIETNLEAIRQRRLLEQAEIDVTNAVSDFSDKERLFLTDAKSNPRRGIYDEAIKWYDDAAQKYSESFAGKDPRIIKAFNEKVKSRRESGLDAVALLEAKEHQNEKQTAFDNAYDSALKDAMVFADDDARIQQILQDTFGGGGAAGKFDTLHPKGKDELTRTKLKDDFLAAVVDQLMISDPAKAKRYLETYKADLGKSWKSLDQKVRQAEFRFDVSADPYLALGKLNEGRYQFDTLTEATNRAFAVGQIEKKARDAEELAKKGREEAEAQVMDFIEKKDLVGATALLDTYEKDRMLSPETRRILRNAINNPKEDLGDMTVYHALEQRILLNKATDGEILKSSLTVPGKNKLLKLRKDDADVRKSYDYVQAMESAQKQIVTTGIMAALDPDQQARFTSYKRAAEKFVQGGGDPWAFYDQNIWKFKPDIPATNYGVPKDLENVMLQEKRLKDDVNAGRVDTKTAKLEAEKLTKARNILMERDKVKQNAPKK